MASSSNHQPNDIVKQPSKTLHNLHLFKVVLVDALKKQKFVRKNYSNIQSVRPVFGIKESKL